MDFKIDIDGTVVEHDYPYLGAPVPHALRVLERIQKAGHRIIANTMRANFKNGSLEQAIGFIEWDMDNDVNVDECLALKESPTEWNPRAESTEIYIDDEARGIPLMNNRILFVGKMVDWLKVEQQLEQVGILPIENIIVTKRRTTAETITLPLLRLDRNSLDIIIRPIHDNLDPQGYFNRRK